MYVNIEFDNKEINKLMDKANELIHDLQLVTTRLAGAINVSCDACENEEATSNN